MRNNVYLDEWDFYRHLLAKCCVEKLSSRVKTCCKTFSEPTSVGEKMFCYRRLPYTTIFKTKHATCSKGTIAFSLQRFAAN